MWHLDHLFPTTSTFSHVLPTISTAPTTTFVHRCCVVVEVVVVGIVEIVVGVVGVVVAHFWIALVGGVAVKIVALDSEVTDFEVVVVGDVVAGRVVVGRVVVGGIVATPLHYNNFHSPNHSSIPTQKGNDWQLHSLFCLACSALLLFVCFQILQLVVWWCWLVGVLC